MAIFTGLTFTGTSRDPAAIPPFAKAGGSHSKAKQRRTTEVFALAGQPVGAQLLIGVLPSTALFKGVRLTTDTSLGAATLSAGSAALPAKYKPAATFTTTDTPTNSALTSALAQGALNAEEPVYLTVGAAALPNSGTLIAELEWVEPA